MVTYGNYHILLPQGFKNTELAIEVKYSIKHGTEWLPQVNSFPLYNGGHYYTTTGTSDQVRGWEMGKRYTYNISIGLDQVYFAPQVDAWEDVDVTFPAI